MSSSVCHLIFRDTSFFSHAYSQKFCNSWCVHKHFIFVLLLHSDVTNAEGVQCLGSAWRCEVFPSMHWIVYNWWKSTSLLSRPRRLSFQSVTLQGRNVIGIQQPLSHSMHTVMSDQTFYTNVRRDLWCKLHFPMEAVAGLSRNWHSFFHH